MAQKMAVLAGTPDDDRAREQEKGVLRRCRGRPRLPDSDRAQRRHESRKKYDVRRVYLGESHKLWSELRRRTNLSDAGLAAYLILVNSTYGDKYQQKYHRKKIDPEFTVKPRKDRKTHVSSLQSLVCWYQEHCCSCPHEPLLRALEPQPNFSTAAIWQCESNHSFVQYLFSPISDSSDSEHEAQVNKVDGEIIALKPKVKESIRRRRKEDHRHLKGVEENADVSDIERNTVSPVEQTAVISQQTNMESPSKDILLAEQPVWEVEMVDGEHQCPTVTSFSPATSVEEAEDITRSQDEGEEVFRTVTVTTPVDDEVAKTVEDHVMSQGSSSLRASIPEKGKLFDPQSLQIPEQQNAVEGSQLIIITGAYEAMASEGVHLSLGGGSMEEVTCTVIGGVSSTQMCMSDSKRQAEDNDCMTGLSDKQLLQPSALELQRKRELHCSLSSVHSKRNRRGPIIEADGMLKMFHCPYEGCSQVYVAISSFQNHINLVHRKGKTKVCPHPGCGKKFYLSNHLHRHMIIHSGVRDFICETCGKSFKRKNHLEVHRRTHTGETPLQCEICGYQCRQRASLNWHMKKHTPEAHYNYTCEFCHKRFEKLDSVKFHKVKSHPEKQTT
ncbi:zinc finger protein 653 [Takifugu rubripes]|uniref:Zinc finger protein 653 n=1 Tax=Takifugu rubripes TaxID=31033 RepID=H2TA17_TAKRU|nr:zinc finger protein 653 [Takifugu rubripes]|eukprot:XP_011604300.1 PREDICTED: zinc finger protein 653 [Takifugu rubripes]